MAVILSTPTSRKGREGEKKNQSQIVKKQGIATMTTKKDILHAKGIDVSIYTEDFKNEYISLTDIAKYKNSDDPRYSIQNWMRNKDTIEYLGLWESLHNPRFNRVHFDAVKSEAGLNRFVMTAKQWRLLNTNKKLRRVALMQLKALSPLSMTELPQHITH